MKRLSSFPLLLGSFLAFGCVVVSNGGDTAGETDSASDSASATVTDSASASASASASDTASATATATASDTATASATDTAGTDSAGTDTGTGDAMFCQEECEEDSDCEVSGVDSGFTCDNNRCVGSTAEGCTENDECVAQFSGWTAGTECMAQADCDAMAQFCIDVLGTNRCVIGPSMALSCDTLMMQEIDTTNADGDMVTVCGQPDAECNDFGGCYIPCGSDADCTVDGYPSCDTGTGLCGCSSDADCETLGNAATSVCLATATCGCGEDQDCVDANLGDTCFDGACGCSADSACNQDQTIFDNTTVVCAGF